MRFLFLFLLIGCNEPHKQLTPSGTKLNPVDRNWEKLYARELSNALINQDDLAFYFFWPLYMQERSYNKCKKYNTKHNINCSCLNK